MILYIKKYKKTNNKNTKQLTAIYINKYFQLTWRNTCYRTSEKVKLVFIHKYIMYINTKLKAMIIFHDIIRLPFLKLKKKNLLIMRYTCLCLLIMLMTRCIVYLFCLKLTLTDNSIFLFACLIIFFPLDKIP